MQSVCREFKSLLRYQIFTELHLGVLARAARLGLTRSVSAFWQ